MANGFGFENPTPVEPVGDDLDDIFTTAASPMPPPPAAETPLETPEPEAPVEPEPEVEPEEETPEPEGEAEPEPEMVTFAGRQFPSQEEAERSYQHMQSMFSRMQNENAQYQERIGQMEQTYERILPMLQAYQAQQQGAVPPQPQGQPDFETDPQAALQVMIQQGVQQALQPWMAQQQYQQQEQASQSVVQQAERDALSAIELFRRQHPEVTEGSAADREIAQVVNLLRDPKTQLAIIDIRDPEQLDMAYEVWKNPELGQVLEANASWIATPGGRNLARRNAGSAVPNGAPAAAGSVARRKPVAHVETGGSGAPVQAAPGERPEGDAFDQVLELDTQLKEKTGVFYR